MPPENTAAPENLATRDLKRVKSASYPEYVDRWAIIVGISKYKHERLNLKYAHRDAEALYRLIQTPSGGGFAKDHIEPLIDEKATTANITRALRSFLKKPAKDDIVLIYFACHGAPDPDRPGDVYLLTHDTDPDDVAGTALPMREIDLSLKEKLLAERVVILADTCHSAAIGGGIGRRSEVDHSAVVNRYLQEVSQTNGGVALLTSAAANEVSFEDEKWDGGHGVFTHYLLKGMKGDADGYSTKQPKDGKVTAGELFDYVRENVERETGNQQHPSIGTNAFDRNLPMAITGGITAHEHYQLGCRLFELGWLLDDDGRFESAIRQCHEALRLTRLSGVSFPEAHFQHGRSLMALGRFNKAVAEFNKTLACDQQKQFPETYLHLGVAYAEQRDHASAIKAFEQFVQLQPQNENTAWVQEYLKMLRSTINAKKHALLIGIDDYPNSPLRGCKNDVKLMKEVLQDYGFQKFTILTDEAATSKGIVAALTRLTTLVSQDDLLVIYYAGHGHFIPDRTGASNTGALGVWLPFDYQKAGYFDCVLFYDSVKKIRTSNITIISDTDHSGDFRWGRWREYNILASCRSDQNAADARFNEQYNGAFTYYLAQQLKLPNPDAKTYGQIIAAVGNDLNKHSFVQVPGLIGQKDQIIFSNKMYDFPFGDLSAREKKRFLNPENISNIYSQFKSAFSSPNPKVHYFFGQAFLQQEFLRYPAWWEQRNYQESVEAMQTAIAQRGGVYPEANLTLAMTAIRLKNFDQTLKSLQSYHTEVHSSSVTAKLEEAITIAKNLKHEQKRALLIGIDEYNNPDVTNVRDTVTDVHAIKKVLIDKLGFQKENIKVLTNRQATRRAIIEEFKKLVEKQFSEPALFYFAGNGSETPDGNPTIISVDGRQKGIYDIQLNELATLISDQDMNLITIIDAGWGHDPTSTHNSRTIPKDSRLKTGDADQNDNEISKNVLPQIGLISIHAGSKSTDRGAPDLRPEPKDQNLKTKDKNEFDGALGRAILQVFTKEDSNNLSLFQFIDLLKNKTKPNEPTVSEYSLDRKFLSRDLNIDEALISLLKRIEKAEPLNKTMQTLHRLIEQRNGIYPEGFLNLGITYAAQENYDESIKAFEKAIAQKEEHYYPEAHYYLGRVLLESQRDLPGAVSELREVTQQQPDNVAAHYFLGKALQALIERESLVEVEKVFKIYLDKGAPQGNEDEVKDFLRKRQDSEENLKKTRTDAEEFQKKVLELLKETEPKSAKKKSRADDFRQKVLALLDGSQEKSLLGTGAVDKKLERLIEEAFKKFEKQRYWIET